MNAIVGVGINIQSFDWKSPKVEDFIIMSSIDQK